MKLGVVALKLRVANTRFGNLIAGAAELDLAMSNTLVREAAFVIPLAEEASRNEYDNHINQVITERFGVVVAVKSDSTDKDKTGILAYDQLHSARSDIFKGILGAEFNWAESPVYYRGGRLLGFDRAYLWYQFEFEVEVRISSTPNQISADLIEREVQGISENTDVLVSGGIASVAPDEGLESDGIIRANSLHDFNTLYANIILSPNENLPYTGDLPLADGFPDVSIPDIAEWIDFTDDPREGSYNTAFNKGFDFYPKPFNKT